MFLPRGMGTISCLSSRRFWADDTKDEERNEPRIVFKREDRKYILGAAPMVFLLMRRPSCYSPSNALSWAVDTYSLSLSTPPKKFMHWNGNRTKRKGQATCLFLPFLVSAWPTLLIIYVFHRRLACKLLFLGFQPPMNRASAYTKGTRNGFLMNGAANYFFLGRRTGKPISFPFLIPRLFLTRWHMLGPDASVLHQFLRLGGEERILMHLVPAPAVRLMKRRVLSRPGVNSLLSFFVVHARAGRMKED